MAEPDAASNARAPSIAPWSAPTSRAGADLDGGSDSRLPEIAWRLADRFEQRREIRTCVESPDRHDRLWPDRLSDFPRYEAGDCRPDRKRRLHPWRSRRCRTSRYFRFGKLLGKLLGIEHRNRG